MSDKAYPLEFIETGLLHNGHSEQIYQLSVSPNGKYLASCSEDKTIKLWDMDQKKCIHSFLQHSSSVQSVNISKDSKQLISSDIKGKVMIWDIESKEKLQTIQEQSVVVSVEFSPDGKKAVIGCQSKIIKIWEIDSSKCLLTLQGHKDMITQVTFSNDGQYIASGSWDYTIKLWNVSSGKCISTLYGHVSYVQCVKFSPNGKVIASGDCFCQIKLWDFKTKECIHTIKAHNDMVKSIAFSPDGKQLISGSKDKCVCVFDVDTAECLYSLTDLPAQVFSIAITPDSQNILIGYGDGQLNIWDTKNEVEVPILHDICKISSNQVQITQSCKKFVTSCRNGTIKIWDKSNCELLQTIQTSINPEEVYASFDLLSQGRKLVYIDSFDKIKVYHIKKGIILKEIGIESRPQIVKASPDSKRIAILRSYSIIEIIDLNNEEKRVKINDNHIFLIQFCLGGNRIICKDKQFLKIWNVHTGKLCGKIRHRNEDDDYTFTYEEMNFYNKLSTFAISGCDSILILLKDYTTIEIWNLANVKKLARRLNSLWNYTITLDLDTRLFYIGGRSMYKMQLWKIQSPKEVAQVVLPEVIEKIIDFSVMNYECVIVYEHKLVICEFKDSKW